MHGPRLHFFFFFMKVWRRERDGNNKNRKRKKKNPTVTVCKKKVKRIKTPNQFSGLLFFFFLPSFSRIYFEVIIIPGYMQFCFPSSTDFIRVFFYVAKSPFTLCRCLLMFSIYVIVALKLEWCNNLRALHTYWQVDFRNGSFPKLSIQILYFEMFVLESAPLQLGLNSISLVIRGMSKHAMFAQTFLYFQLEMYLFFVKENT